MLSLSARQIMKIAQANRREALQFMTEAAAAFSYLTE